MHNRNQTLDDPLRRRAFRAACKNYLGLTAPSTAERELQFLLLYGDVREWIVKVCSPSSSVLFQALEATSDRGQSEPVVHVKELFHNRSFDVSCTAEKVREFIVACVDLFGPDPPWRRPAKKGFRGAVGAGSRSVA